MIYSIKHHVYIDGTEVCGSMNHCIQGGISDGDGGEDSREGNAGRRAASVAGGGAWTPPAPPAIKGMHRP